MLTTIGGINSKSGTVDPTDCTLVTKTRARIDLYVRDDIGNDSNPGTIELPLKTLAAAEAKLPDVIAHPSIIHLGAHPEGGWIWPLFRARVLQGSHIIVIGDGAGKSGDDGFTEIVPPTAALAGSGVKAVVSSGLDDSPCNGYGAYCGCTIEILTGDAAGDRRSIKKNSTTQYVPSVAFSSAVAAGDSYRVVRPSIQIAYTIHGMAVDCGTPWSSEDETQWYGLNIIHGSYLVLVNLIFGDPSYYFELFIEHSGILLLGCEVNTLCYMHGSGVFRIGVETGFWGNLFEDTPYNEGVPLGRDLFSTPHSTSWSGWGFSNMYLDDCTIVISQVQTDMVGIQCGEILTTGAQATMLAGCIWWGLNVGEHDTAGAANVRIVGYYADIEIGSNNTSNAVRVANDKFSILALGDGGVPGMEYGTVSLRSVNEPLVAFRDAKVYLEVYDEGALSMTCMSPPGGMLVYQTAEICVRNQLPAMNCGGKDFSVNGGLVWHPIADLVVGAHFTNPLYGHIYRTGDL